MACAAHSSSRYAHYGPSACAGTVGSPLTAATPGLRLLLLGWLRDVMVYACRRRCRAPVGSAALMILLVDTLFGTVHVCTDSVIFILIDSVVPIFYSSGLDTGSGY
jgi:hypothetical protein